jgi:hypothetical protein
MLMQASTPVGARAVMLLCLPVVLRSIRIRAGRIFVALLVVAATAMFDVGLAEAQNLAIPFIDPFNPAVIKTSLAPASRWGLFRESDSIGITNTDGSSIRVLNLDGLVVYSGPPTSLHLTRGHYFIECNGDRDQFAVLPDDYVGSSFLGMEALPPGNDVNVLSAVKPAWLRIGVGALWTDVQPGPGIWNWTSADQVVSNNAGSGRKLIWDAFYRPSWVADDNQFISLYSNFVSQVVQRYGSQLYAIEVWNEPWTTCDLWGRLPNLDNPNQCMTNWTQMAQSYTRVLQAARAAVHAVAPNVRVIGPAWSNPHYGDVVAYLNGLGATALLDAMSFHDYDDGGAAPDQSLPFVGTDYPNPRVDQNITAFQSALGNSSTPLMVDEVGLYGSSALGIPNTGNPTYLSGISWQRGMYRAAKMAVMYEASGVQAFIPHVLYTSTTDPTSNLEIYGYELGGRGPHPKTSAVLMTGYALNGSTSVGYRTPATNMFLYAWQQADHTSLVVAWALEGQNVPLQTSGLPVATDIFGRTNNASALTEQPLFFRSSSSDALGLLNTVRAHIQGPSNLAPVLNPLSTESTVAGQPLQFTIAATDADNDPITYSASALPPGATFDPLTQTFSWTPGAGASGPYTATFVATDSLGASTSLSTTITVLGNLLDGLTAHWKFDEASGTTAADSMGSNNGTLVNFTPGSGWGPGIVSNALSFDGISDFVSLDSNQITLTNNFSIALWIKPGNAAGVGAFFSVRSSYPVSGFRLFVLANSLSVQGDTMAGTQAANFAPNAISDGVWSHVVVVYDNSNLSTYLNGTLQGSTNLGGDFIMNATWPSAVGKENSFFFKGTVDDTMVFQRALTAPQILALYQSATYSLTPSITSLKLSGSDVVISFTTVSSIVTNETYEVDYRNDLKIGAWFVLTNGIPGSGSTLSITDKGAVRWGKRFYRVGGHY